MKNCHYREQFVTTDHKLQKKKYVQLLYHSNISWSDQGHRVIEMDFRNCLGEFTILFPNLLRRNEQKMASLQLFVTNW